jgi:porin
VFSRISASPSDRNPIDFYADGGIIFSGMIPARPDDKFGASIMFARYSDAARAFDRDLTAFTGAPGTVRSFEANLELNYTYQVIPGWNVQPILTYVWHPSGLAALSPETAHNATVIGLRSMWQY